jgi:Anaphase-promoting complex subunit 4 WD40 domain/WD domain, G-beta repeat
LRRARPDRDLVTDDQIPAARLRPVSAGAPVVAAHFLGTTAAFVLGEEAVLLVSANQEQRVAVHAGGILAAAADGGRVVTGGDDGNVIATRADATNVLVARDTAHRWIDRVAIGPNGAVAWAAGKSAFVMTANGAPRALEVPSSIGGLAFAPKGFRLAVAHYNGVSLWYPQATSAPQTLAWKGSHLTVTWSPDARFVISAMQEPALHGWRLADRTDLRMSGYKTKVRSLDWTASGDWLATGGADQLVLWPFQGKDGPMSRSPQLLASSPAAVFEVACHPKEELIAVGYADGLVLLVRIKDGAQLIARRPDDVAVSALAWNPEGTLLAFGTESGDAGIIDLR